MLELSHGHWRNWPRGQLDAFFINNFSKRYAIVPFAELIPPLYLCLSGNIGIVSAIVE